MKELKGAFSLVVLTDKAMVAVRDAHGFRPLVLGRKKNAEGVWIPVLSSETCAFDLIGAEFEREIRPGELYWVDEDGEHSQQIWETQKHTSCIFEHIYFSRPDSVIFGHSAYNSRKRMGQILAKESPANADMVVPVPDSGVAAAIGYSQEAGLPFEFGIIRNHYVGRTFIEPKQSIRSFGVKIKLNPQRAVLKGKSVVVVDDSLVRGTTSKKIIQLVRQMGAHEVHFRVSSPPIVGACCYGIDTPTNEELVANQFPLEEICEEIGADSLAYLTLEGLYQAVPNGRASHCAACFNLDYPHVVT